MKAAERKMAEELMALTLEAIEKTGSYVSFQISDYGPFIHICAMENGFQEKGMRTFSWTINPSLSPFIMLL